MALTLSKEENPIYTAYAPATLMLMGEHSVLYDRSALVTALHQFIKVSIKVRNDRSIHIRSNLGEIESSLDDLIIQKPFQFVLTAIQHFKDKLSNGFEMVIASDFSDSQGLGSSAAVTVATVAALKRYVTDLNKQEFNAHLDNKDFKLQLFDIAKSIIQKVQGVGSGADIAACIFGGVIHYQKGSPWILEHLPYLLPLDVVYVGYKTPTVEVIKKVSETFGTYSEVYEKIYDAIDECVRKAVRAIRTNDLSSLGKLMNINQGLMSALGVSTPLSNAIVDTLRALPDNFGSKISGSGLGDCIIGLGRSNHFNLSTVDEMKWLKDGILIVEDVQKVKKIDVHTSLQGVKYE